MIKVEELEFLAKNKEKENLRFRKFLKEHVDSEDLDEQFLRLHNKFFKIYDCDKCRNCCIKCCGTIPIDDLERDANYLKMSREQFIEKYLNGNPDYDGYSTKNTPCDFYVDNKCILEECKPEQCKQYPHTNIKGRLFSLYSVMDNTFVCPVVYEIVEELKKYYAFIK